MDLSAAMLVLSFYYDVYISSYSELIMLLFTFSDRCVLSCKPIYQIYSSHFADSKLCSSYVINLCFLCLSAFACLLIQFTCCFICFLPILTNVIYYL